MVRPCRARGFSILVAAVLHQCIRLLIGAFAPSHHGYQRACDLISGPASKGPFGSPVFACAGKTDSPSSSLSSRRPRRVTGLVYVINNLLACAVTLFVPAGRLLVPVCG